MLQGTNGCEHLVQYSPGGLQGLSAIVTTAVPRLLSTQAASQAPIAEPVPTLHHILVHCISPLYCRDSLIAASYICTHLQFMFKQCVVATTFYLCSQCPSEAWTAIRLGNCSLNGAQIEQTYVLKMAETDAVVCRQHKASFGYLLRLSSSRMVSNLAVRGRNIPGKWLFADLAICDWAFCRG